ncbi:MAG: hypothetical protein IPJ69_03365 [Deltaproteobacteria bacterium]|nr:MAG: hypothetical protein IPJ69_03365 [Deltaproteobacteria bacterium]
MQNKPSISLDTPKLLSPEEISLKQLFIDQFQLHPILAQILVSRGFREIQDAQSFLFGDLAQLPNPFELSGMLEAVIRVVESISHKQKILLFGDYDVDGITGCAQLALFLKEIGATVDVLLPHRIHDGYGLAPSSVEKIKIIKPDLLITIDNGTIFLMALRSKLREHTLKLPNLKRYLDLACLGTIADVVPLTGTNRLLVKYGLKELTTSQRPGIKALKEVSSVSEDVTPYIVGFRLAPRINAAGRMADPKEALQLLMSSTENEAQVLAQKLEAYNRQRQAEEEKALNEAFTMIETSGLLERRGIVVGSKTWHLGIVGILAARLTEKYHRPAIALSFFEDKNIAKGSARSIAGFSVYAALKNIEHKMINFGGHEAAAGMTLDLKSLEDFSESFHQSIESLSPEPFRKKIRVDSILPFNEISPLLLEQLSLFEPFGSSNPEPTFMTEDAKLHSCRIIGSGNNHLKFSASHSQLSFDGIYFNGAKDLETILKTTHHQLIYNLQKNTWNGRSSIQLKLKTLL